MTKRALIKWEEYQDRLPTEREIDRWWQMYPNAGVGIITGKISNLVVLDVDPKHGGDAHHVWETFPTPLVARTGGGGGHFFYEYPKNTDYVPNVVGKTDGEPNGYDLRADGGYVIAAPSSHSSGRRYEWVSTGETPAPVPPELLKEILPKRGLNGKAGMTEPWLADALQGVGEGARDDTCARLAGYYFSKGMPSDVVLETLFLWNDRNDPPLDPGDIQKTVDSIQRTRSRKPAVASTGRHMEDAPQELLRLISLHQYMAAYGQIDIQWAVADWLPDATIGMLVSPPGTYKTWILIDLALSIATGTKFLGAAAVRRQGPVLIYQQEDFHGQMAQRIATITASRFPMGLQPNNGGDPSKISLIMPPDPPIYLHDNRELRFDNPDIMDILEARIKELRPVLVIIDPLYTAASMDDYMAKAIPHMMRLKRLRDLYGCSFMIAHHTGKRSEATSREDAWGSQFLNAFLETGWQVRPKRESTALIRRHFKVSKDIEEMTLTFDIHTDLPTRYAPTLQRIDAQVDADVDILHQLDKQGPMTVDTMAKRLDMSRAHLYRQVKVLLDSGALVKDERNRLTPVTVFNVTG